MLLQQGHETALSHVDVRQVYSVELLAVAGSVCVVARGRQAGLQC